MSYELYNKLSSLVQERDRYREILELFHKALIEVREIKHLDRSLELVFEYLRKLKLEYPELIEPLTRITVILAKKVTDLEKQIQQLSKEFYEKCVDEKIKLGIHETVVKYNCISSLRDLGIEKIEL